jgi:hypothetical protein
VTEKGNVLQWGGTRGGIGISDYYIFMMGETAFRQSSVLSFYVHSESVENKIQYNQPILSFRISSKHVHAQYDCFRFTINALCKEEVICTERKNEKMLI